MAPNYYRSDLWVKLVSGQAVAGALVYVCTQPANVFPPAVPPRTTPVPWQGPNPLSLIYSDEGLTPITQPVVTSGTGHANYYVLPGLYTVVIMYNGAVQEVLQDQSIGNIGSSGGTSILLSTNGSPNFQQGILNIQQGPGITLFSANDGTTTITSTGGGGGVAVEVNGIPLSSSSILNLENSPTVLFTDAGAGAVTAYAVPNVSILPTPDVKRFAMWESATGQAPFAGAFGVTPWIVTNDVQTSTDSGATQTSITATALRNQAIQFTCENFNYREYIGQQVFWPGRTNNFLTRLEVNYDPTADGKTYFGLCDQMFLASGPDPTPGNFIGFATDRHISDPFPIPYLCEVYVAGSQVFTFTTSVYAVVGNAHDFNVRIVGGTVTFFIDGVSVATTSVGLPTTPLGLYIGDKSRNGSSVPDVNIIVEYLYNEVQNVQ